MARWATACLAAVMATNALTVRPVRVVTPRRSVITCVAPAKIKQKLAQSTINPGDGGTDDGDREREHERQNVEDLEDPKMFNVMLLGDDDYTQEHICTSILDVVEDVQKLRGMKRGDRMRCGHAVAQEHVCSGFQSEIVAVGAPSTFAPALGFQAMAPSLPPLPRPAQ